MEHTDHQDCVLKRLVEDQVVTEFRHGEPSDLPVTRSRLANVSSKTGVLSEEVGRVEDGLSNVLRGFGIRRSNLSTLIVQIALGFWTEPGADHERWRNSSVVLERFRFSSPSSSNFSSPGDIMTSLR